MPNHCATRCNWQYHYYTTTVQQKKKNLKQFGSELVPGVLDLPISYTKSVTIIKVWIWTDSDVADVWSFLRSNEAVSTGKFAPKSHVITP